MAASWTRASEVSGGTRHPDGESLVLLLLSALLVLRRVREDGALDDLDILRRPVSRHSVARRARF